VAYLVKKYGAQGVILHGSRALGYARPRSDWDLIIFTNRSGRKKEAKVDIYKNCILELMLFDRQFPRQKIEHYLAKYMSTARLLYWSNQGISDLFTTAENIYRKGPRTSVEDWINYKAILFKDVSRISDWENDRTGTFTVRCVDLYKKFYDLWWKKQSRYPISPRIGMNVIRNYDLKYYRLLKILLSNKGKKLKHQSIIALAKEMGI